MDSSNLAICIGPNVLAPDNDQHLSFEAQKDLNNKVCSASKMSNFQFWASPFCVPLHCRGLVETVRRVEASVIIFTPLCPWPLSQTGTAGLCVTASQDTEAFLGLSGASLSAHQSNCQFRKLFPKVKHQSKI